MCVSVCVVALAHVECRVGVRKGCEMGWDGFGHAYSMCPAGCAQAISKFADLSSRSIVDENERDCFMLKNVIKPHENIVR